MQIPPPRGQVSSTASGVPSGFRIFSTQEACYSINQYSELVRRGICLAFSIIYGFKFSLHDSRLIIVLSDCFCLFRPIYGREKSLSNGVVAVLTFCLAYQEILYITGLVNQIDA